jgi:hypothetical protein
VLKDGSDLFQGLRSYKLQSEGQGPALIRMSAVVQEARKEEIELQEQKCMHADLHARGSGVCETCA